MLKGYSSTSQKRNRIKFMNQYLHDHTALQKQVAELKDTNDMLRAVLDLRTGDIHTLQTKVATYKIAIHTLQTKVATYKIAFKRIANMDVNVADKISLIFVYESVRLIARDALSE